MPSTMTVPKLRRRAVISEPKPDGLRAFDRDKAERFEAYVSRFRNVFQRSDQFLRFRAYLRGLLEPSDRKNVESKLYRHLLFSDIFKLIMWLLSIV